MAECKNIDGIEDYRFAESSTCDNVIVQQFRKKDSNGDYVFEGDYITFSEGDHIPAKVYIDPSYNKLSVDSYHAFHLLDDLKGFVKHTK